MNIFNIYTKRVVDRIQTPCIYVRCFSSHDNRIFSLGFACVGSKLLGDSPYFVNNDSLLRWYWYYCTKIMSFISYHWNVDEINNFCHHRVTLMTIIKLELIFWNNCRLKISLQFFVFLINLAIHWVLNSICPLLKQTKENMFVLRVHWT